MITALSFSPNGKHLLALTSGHVHYVLDAYTGVLLVRLEGAEGLDWKKGVESERGNSGEEGGWSGDGKFVIAGELEEARARTEGERGGGGGIGGGGGGHDESNLFLLPEA